MKQKVIFGVLFIAVLVFWSGVLGNKGLYQLLKLRSQKDELQVKIAQIEKENLLLKRKVESLEIDSEEIKRAIHSELGFIKDNEVIFEFVD